MLNSTSTVVDDLSPEVLWDIYIIPLIIIGLGLIGNTTSFFIYTFNKEMNKYSSMVFLSFIAVTDTLGLFGWNLDHYLVSHHKIWLPGLNMPLCKILPFLQYVLLQCSGFLYSFISVDRFFTVISKPGSFASRLPFGTRKAALIWSISIILFLVLFNLHLLLFNGYYKTVMTNSTLYDAVKNQTIYQTKRVQKLVCYASLMYEMWPLWDIVQYAVYTVIPFIIMFIFNGLLIAYVYVARKTSSKTTSSNKKITFTLLAITFSFIIMTTPGSLTFAFFFDTLKSTAVGHAFLIALDSIMFLHQTMIFWVSFLTNQTFANIVKSNLRRLFCGSKADNYKQSEPDNSKSNQKTEKTIL